MVSPAQFALLYRLHEPTLGCSRRNLSVTKPTGSHSQSGLVRNAFQISHVVSPGVLLDRIVALFRSCSMIKQHGQTAWSSKKIEWHYCLCGLTCYTSRSHCVSRRTAFQIGYVVPPWGFLDRFVARVKNASQIKH